MSDKKNNGIKIIGTGSYSPPHTVTNDDLSKILNTSDEWIYSRTGIKSRSYNEGRPNYLMAIEAAGAALENAGIQPADLDYIMLSTSTPDFIYPITAGLVQGALGAENAACLDINSACTGFVAGLDAARSMLYSGYNRILLIASECLSFHADFSDRTTCVLFGDGAGAAVLERCEEDRDKLFSSYMKAKGVSPADPVLYYKQENKHNIPFTDKLYRPPAEYAPGFLRMSGQGVYKFAVEVMPEAAKAACSRAGLSVHDIDIFIPHQANLRIIQTAAKSLGVPMEKVYTNIEHHGNTSSACMPIALDELNKAGRLKEGMKLCFVGFGAGLTYGAVVMEL